MAALCAPPPLANQPDKTALGRPGANGLNRSLRANKIDGRNRFIWMGPVNDSPRESAGQGVLEMPARQPGRPTGEGRSQGRVEWGRAGEINFFHTEAPAFQRKRPDWPGFLAPPERQGEGRAAV